MRLLCLGRRLEESSRTMRMIKERTGQNWILPSFVTTFRTPTVLISIIEHDQQQIVYEQ